MINEWFQELKLYVAILTCQFKSNFNRHFDAATLDILTMIKYHGQSRERSLAKLCEADIVITTYHTLAADAAKSKNLMNDIEWYRLVLDEGKKEIALVQAVV